MLLTLHNGTRQARLWLSTSVTWTAKADGRFGTASFVIPRNHRVWQSGILNPSGGQLVRVEADGAVFAGVAREPVWDDEGARITLLEIAEWVGVRALRKRREFRACPAAVIVRRAIEDAFVGSAVLPVTIGPCAIGGPLIPRYTFDGRQTVQTVLAAMVEQTGHEWTIDHATYQFRWQPQVGRYREGLLTDIGELFPTVRGRDLTQRYQQATEIDSRTRRTFTALNPTLPPLFPSQSVVEV